MSPHHSDQMVQWSQVSSIALCMAKVKVSDSVSQWVSEWQGHLLSCSGHLKISLSRIPVCVAKTLEESQARSSALVPVCISYNPTTKVLFPTTNIFESFPLLIMCAGLTTNRFCCQNHDWEIKTFDNPKITACQLAGGWRWLVSNNQIQMDLLSNNVQSTSYANNR